MSNPRLCNCADCGEHKPHSGRGLCDACHRRHSRAGTLNKFARTRLPTATRFPTSVDPLTVPVPEQRAAQLTMTRTAIRAGDLTGLRDILTMLETP